MKNILYIKRLWLLLLCVVVTNSCVKRELEIRPTSGRLELRLNWDETTAPDDAKLLIYKEDGTLHQSREYSSGEHCFECELETGCYKIIAHNTNAEGVGYSELDNHATAQIYALNLAGEMPSAGESLSEISNVYGIGVHDDGQTCTIERGRSTNITVTPVLLTKNVIFHFSVAGLQTISEFIGLLHGVSSSVNISTGKSGTTSCNQPFSPTLAASSSKVSTVLNYIGSMYVFNLLTDSDSSSGVNVIDLVITDGDGNPYNVSIDITDVLQQIIEDNGGILPIDIGLELELVVNSTTAEIGAIVKPWDDSGTGGGKPKIIM